MATITETTTRADWERTLRQFLVTREQADTRAVVRRVPRRRPAPKQATT